MKKIDILEFEGEEYQFVGGGSTDIVAEGVIDGAGGALVVSYFDASIGCLFHVETDGDWSDGGYGRAYTKLGIGYRDMNDVTHLLFNIACGTTISPSGYDVYINPWYAKQFKDLYIAIRAAAGESISYTITKIAENVVKDYFVTEIGDTIRKVKARQLNDKCLTFALVTDIHYRGTDEQISICPYGIFDMSSNMRYISKDIRLDNVVCLGDAIDGTYAKDVSLCDAEDIMRAFGNTGNPLLYVIGNHDDNRYVSGGRFTRQEIVGNFICPVDERTIGGTMGGCNYYRDIDRLKIRMIVAMSINFSGFYEYTAETRSWLSETINTMPVGYKAVIFSHVPPLPSQAWNNIQYTGGEGFASIVEDAGDRVICMFEGHTHLDNTFLTPYVAVMSGCEKCYNISSLTGVPEDSVFPERAVGDYRQDLWNVVVIDAENEVINVVRFGAGVDRYIHYAPVGVQPGGSTTLSPDIITAATWHTRESESSYISVSSGTVSVSQNAPVGSRLSVSAIDDDGNQEFWVVKVL